MLWGSNTREAVHFFIPRSRRISFTHISPYTMTELRIYHLFVVYLILRIMSYSIFWLQIKFCLLWKILTKRGTRKKRSIFSCVTVRGNRARQAIMIHNFAKDENGSFEKPLSAGRFTTVLESSLNILKSIVQLELRDLKNTQWLIMKNWWMFLRMILVTR